jgi:hypothetical protein
MSGMLIDTLAYQFMETYEHRSKSFLYHDYMARDFFDFLSKQDQTWWRAPGSGAWVARKGIQVRGDQKSRAAGSPVSLKRRHTGGPRNTRRKGRLAYLRSLEVDPIRALRRDIEEH